jgi:hypothetical protein
MNQPYGMLAKNLLATPHYPAETLGHQPFDVVSWDYGLMRDVQVVPVTTTLGALSLIPVTTTVPYAGNLAGAVASSYVIEHQSNNNLATALPALWADPDFSVTQADAAITVTGQVYPPGTFIVQTQGSQADHDKLVGLAQDLGLTIHAVADAADLSGTPLHQPKVGIYTPNNSTGNTMPEGWTRYRFDHSQFPYTRLYPADVRNGTDLHNQYDVIVISDLSTSSLINGSTTVPDPYKGGISASGVANLKSFAEAGGTLVLLQRSSLLPISQGWNIGVAQASAAQASTPRLAPETWQGVSQTEEEPDRGGLKPDPKFLAASLYSPGSVVRINVDPATRVGYGYKIQETSWLVDTNTPFYTVISDTVQTVATYPATGPLLLNGYVSNDSVIRGKAAIVDATLGKGHVVLLGPNVVYRGQMTADYMFLWNAVVEGGR